jgi:hypothetical protein
MDPEAGQWFPATIHADSRAIQYTGVCAQGVQSGTACGQMFQVSEP